MKVIVVIPTTAGLVTIRRIARRPGVPTSFVVADGDYRPLYASDDYGRLTALGGALASAVGAEQAGSFELRVDRQFETGRSWEVPVCVAHALLASAFTLVDRIQEADLAVWATGAVDADLSIVATHYAVAAKLEKSAAWFRSAVEAGCRVVVGIPPGEDAEVLAEQAKLLASGPAVDIIIASRVSDVLFKCVDRGRRTLPIPIGRDVVGEIFVPEKVRQTRPGRHGVKSLAMAFVGAVALGISAWAIYDRYLTVTAQQGSAKNQASALRMPLTGNGDTHSPPGEQTPVAPAPPAPEPVKLPEPIKQPQPPVAAPKVTLTELRAPRGLTCSELLYGDVAGERRAIPVSSDGKFESSDADGLCAVEYDATVAGTFAELSLEGSVLNAGPRKVSAPGSTANRFRKLAIFLRQGQVAPITYRISIYERDGAAANPVQTTYAHELRHAR